MSNRAHRRRRTPRPNRAEVDAAARFSAAALGCTCHEVDVRMRSGHLHIEIGHDPGCPAEHAGTVLTLIARGHLRRPDATP